MLAIIPGKLREVSYKQLNVNQFVSLLLQTKAITTILKPKSPYLLSSTPFCDFSLVIWTTTKEKWAVYVVTSMAGAMSEVNSNLNSECSDEVEF